MTFRSAKMGYYIRAALSLNFQSSNTAQERLDTTGHVSLFPAAETSKTTAGPRKHSLMHFVFLSDGGTPKCRGARCNLPFLSPLSTDLPCCVRIIKSYLT